MGDLIGIAIAGATVFGLPAFGDPAPQERVVLSGNTNPKALPQYDRGPVRGSQRVFQMQLIERVPGLRQEELNRVLEGQQDPTSPNYHRFLAPEQYADRFGWTPEQVEMLKAWLVGQGFRVDSVARARNAILFSGTAEQVEQAFQTQIDRFVVEGETHFANTSNPSVPAEFAPLIQSIRGLDDFGLVAE